MQPKNSIFSMHELDKNVLDKIDKVFYHGTCADGIIAREFMKLFFNRNIKYIPYYFNVLDETPKNALFIDCSPKDFQVPACLEYGCVIIEHHDSFQESYKRYYDSFSKQMILGDTSSGESGALLACQLIQKYGKHSLTFKEKEIARLIAISDTWQKDSEDFAYARGMQSYIVFFGNDFNLTLTELYDNQKNILSHMKVAQQTSLTQARTALKTTMPYLGSNIRVAFINDLKVSDSAELLRNEDIPLTVGFMIIQSKDKFVIRYSLRSIPEIFNSKVFCIKNGGGGHDASAGFEVEYTMGKDPIGYFYELMRRE